MTRDPLGGTNPAHQGGDRPVAQTLVCVLNFSLCP
jgi:hypothetical protein